MNVDPKNSDIQVLRILAAGLVLLQHFSFTPTFIGLVTPYFHMPFYLGVEIFFVISGYVVTKSLHHARNGRPSSAAGFFIRRIFRLYPAIFVFLFISGIGYIFVRLGDFTSFEFSKAQFLEETLRVLSGTVIIDNKPVLYTNGAMWSLSVEFQFYFLYTLLWLILSPRAIQPYRKKIILAVALAAFLVCLITRITIIGGHVPGRLMYYFLNWKFDFIITGVLIAYLPKIMGYNIFYTGFIITLPFWLASLVAGNPDQSTLSAYALREGLIHTIFLFSTGFLVWAASVHHIFPPSHGRLYSALVWLGDRSYGIYLFHFPIFLLVWIFFATCFPFAFSTAIRYAFSQVLFSLPIIICFSALSYTLIEQPLNARGKKIADAIDFRPNRKAEGPVQP